MIDSLLPQFGGNPLFATLLPGKVREKYLPKLRSSSGLQCGNAGLDPLLLRTIYQVDEILKYAPNPGRAPGLGRSITQHLFKTIPFEPIDLETRIFKRLCQENNT